MRGADGNTINNTSLLSIRGGGAFLGSSSTKSEWEKIKNTELWKETDIIVGGVLCCLNEKHHLADSSMLKQFLLIHYPLIFGSFGFAFLSLSKYHSDGFSQRCPLVNYPRRKTEQTIQWLRCYHIDCLTQDCGSLLHFMKHSTKLLYVVIMEWEYWLVLTTWFNVEHMAGMFGVSMMWCIIWTVLQINVRSTELAPLHLPNFIVCEMSMLRTGPF